MNGHRSAGIPLLFFLAWAAAYAEAPYPPGQITEGVRCLRHPDQTYALYIPSNFDMKERYPILYVFDPVGRGKTAVEVFRAAAEAHGFVVAGSDGSRNGPWEPVRAAVDAVWEDTHVRLPLNPKRVYAAGFSGGARVACWLGARNPGTVAGVLACGAGFPGEMAAPQPLPYAIVFMAGERDFNYLELRDAHALVEKQGGASVFLPFSGGHEWPPAGDVGTALGWLEIWAARDGLRPRDPGALGGFLREQAASIESMEAAGSPVEAAIYARCVERQVRGLCDVTAVSGMRGRIESGRAYSDSLRLEREVFAAERAYFAAAGEVMTRLRGAAPSEKLLSKCLITLNLEKLRGVAAAAASASERNSAKRRINFVLTTAMMELGASREKGDSVREIFFLRLMTSALPSAAPYWVELARAYARGGDDRGAIRCLKKAGEAGFTDWKSLCEEPGFESLRGFLGGGRGR